MSDESNAQIETRVMELFGAGEGEPARRELQLLLDRQKSDRGAALAILRIVESCDMEIKHATEFLSRVFDAHESDAEVVGLIGECIDRARDIDLLNAPPPEDDLFASVLRRLSVLAGEVRGEDLEELVVSGLAHTARLMARQHDAIAEESYRRLVALDPQSSSCHYNLGLFFKTRGRFGEGVEANQSAIKLARKPHEAHLWNLGICATGAGQAHVALDVWKQIGQTIEIGRFGLPEARYSTCKVRLAQRPLAERDAANDDPGLEETIWIERLSPCHGIVRSVLYEGLGVDYGDVVLIDGAPITHHRYGDDRIPVFPHLATLLRRGYQFFDFAGVQTEKGQLKDLSGDLSEDAVVYSHTESFRLLCASCWRNKNIDHDHNDALTEHVVTGSIAAPPHTLPAALLNEIDAAIVGHTGCEIYAPTLSAAAGLEARAAEDRRRFELLCHSGPTQ